MICSHWLPKSCAAWSANSALSTSSRSSEMRFRWCRNWEPSWIVIERTSLEQVITYNIIKRKNKMKSFGRNLKHWAAWSVTGGHPNQIFPHLVKNDSWWVETPRLHELVRLCRLCSSTGEVRKDLTMEQNYKRHLRWGKKQQELWTLDPSGKADGFDRVCIL